MLKRIVLDNLNDMFNVQGASPLEIKMASDCVERLTKEAQFIDISEGAEPGE